MDHDLSHNGAPRAPSDTPLERRNLLGTLVTLCDYGSAADLILAAARSRRPLAVCAQAVHGIVTAWLDRSFGAVLNGMDLVTPDGQPVRWALNWIHEAGLAERVYGPSLMLEVCRRAAAEQLPIFLYGATPEVLDRLADQLTKRYPALRVAGSLAPPFRALTAAEEDHHRTEIGKSGARLVFVGLGCPRQERWALRNREPLGVPLLAVGAAFDFLSGTKPQAPRWMQDRGLEWLFRLSCEPRRLAGRYLLLNPLYVTLVVLQRLGLRFSPAVPEPGRRES